MSKNKEKAKSASNPTPAPGSDSTTESAAAARWRYTGPMCVKMVLHSTGETIKPLEMCRDEEKILDFQKRYPDRADWFVKK